jgi:hypothetical protein
MFEVFMLNMTYDAGQTVFVPPGRDVGGPDCAA